MGPGPGAGERHCLVVKTGTTVASVAARRGDFEAWIAAGLGPAAGTVRTVRVDAGEPLPEPAEPGGVVVTGSSAMVSAREPWSEATARWLARAVAAGTPVLGICYGHQLLAHALGGRVGPNPAGREIGTAAARLTAAAAADALLSGLPSPTPVQTSHVEAVLALPASAVRLAVTDLDPNHAFRVGARAWGVQFHPEFDADIMRGYLAARREILCAERFDVDAHLASVVEAPAGPRVLRRFAAVVAAR
jgi:GMP synthase (glutamine-hydrolysing)